MARIESYCQKDSFFGKVSALEMPCRSAIEDLLFSSNHATFFYAQLAAVKMMADDAAGAQDALNRYFNGQFMDHIAASGEQPFEAVRANPYHYRCFNLEAMIVSMARRGGR
jgi:hypothetical protein